MAKGVSVPVKDKRTILSSVKQKTGSRVISKSQTKNQNVRRRIFVKKNPLNVAPQAKKRKRRVIQDSDVDEPLARLAKKRKTQRRVIQDSDDDEPLARLAKSQKGKKRNSPVLNHFEELILTVDGIEVLY